MRKLITENPQGMVEHAHNFVFVKNNEVYVRDGESEISLVEYIRKMDKELYGIEHDDEYCNATDFGEYMDDGRFTCTMYHALVGFAEVRQYLKYYEDKIGDSSIDELLKYQDEAEKIMATCSKPCHMGKDIKLIEKEYNLGHEPYGQILAQYEQQIKDCPKICPRYKVVE